MKKSPYPLLLLVLICIAGTKAMAQDEIPWYLKAHFLSEEEVSRMGEIGRDFYPTDPPPAPVRNVAEFERMQSVLIRYPFGIPMGLIVEMAENCDVTTLVANGSQENTVRNLYIQNGIDISKCDFIIAPTESYWTRDYGPWFVINGQGEFGIANFPYNRPRPNDDDVPIAVANYLDIELYGMSLYHTGGNYMTDGYGTSASTDLTLNENPDLTQEEVDSLMLAFLGIDTYHLLSDPLQQPPQDPIEHIDCWGKFLAVDKVLISQVPQSDPRYDDFEYVADYFAEQSCSYGYNYEVYRVMAPGNYPYTPYTNSLILNKKALVPITGHEDDSAALAVYAEAMPGYEVIGVEDDGSHHWINSDALHCRTKGIADLGMLFIKHYPLYGEVPYQEEGYNISAIIRPYSGEALYPDSLRVYYQVNGGVYASEIMAQVFGYKYEATIPAKPIGSEISYYIFAADESGRRENHPFIGSPDPHVFTIGAPLVADVTVEPDSLVYLTYEQCLEGQNVYVTNPSEDSSVVITDINHEGWEDFFWCIEPWNVNLPHTMQPEGSLILTVKIGITTAEMGQMLYDTLFIETVASTHQVIICVDGDLVDVPEKQTGSFTLFPNPFQQNTHIRLQMNGPEHICIEVFDITGKHMFTLADDVFNAGNHILTWDGKNKSNQTVDPGVYVVGVKMGKDVEYQKLIKTL